MKKLLLLSVILSVLASCGGRRHIERTLHSGDYNEAIQDALRKLSNNKDKKRKEDYILLLRDAFYKAEERDANRIKQLKKDGNPAYYKQIFDMYSDLNARQEAIKPYLPLYVDGDLVPFRFKDYSDVLVDYKNKTSAYLYDQASIDLQSNNKLAIRDAYNTFKYIDRINPNFRNVNAKIEEAYQLGTDYVIVSIKNDTQQMIPRRLEDDLLNFDTYGLNQFWTVYHGNQVADLDYDYQMMLMLRQINISPERIAEREILREREIVDGWEYQLDQNGNVMQDSLGNDIKIDKIITARARFYEYNQNKAVQVLAQVQYKDLRTNQTLDNFPIDSGFIFENFYATFRGDRRALTDEDLRMLNGRQMPFPSNEQMVFDAGKDLKQKLKAIISSYKMRQ